MYCGYGSEIVYVPPVAAGALLWAADDVLATADAVAVGAEEVPCGDAAGVPLDVDAVAAGFDDEHATRLATMASDSAVVLATRRPIVDVFTDFLPKLGSMFAQQMRSRAAMARVGQIAA